MVGNSYRLGLSSVVLLRNYLKTYSITCGTGVPPVFMAGGTPTPLKFEIDFEKSLLLGFY